MKSKRFGLTLPPDADEIVETQLIGMGKKKPERVKNIVMIYLTERGYLRCPKKT